jgi:DHA1 family bicyclomycin/chloramphenicol resistance-like MFS transporter
MAKLLSNIVIILCLISTVARFALDSYLPSLPNITLAFATTPELTELSISLYLFGFGFSQLGYGPLSDYYGRKKILIMGLMLFISASLLSSLCSSIFPFLACRLLAGIGCGAAGVINRAIARDCYQGAEFAKVWSNTTSAVVITLMVAPLLGAVVQTYFDWRINLNLATLYVAIVLMIIIKRLPETNRSSLLRKPVLSCILTTYTNIISHKQFLGAVYCYTFAFAGLMIYFQLSPFLYIETLGLTTIQYGCLSLIIAASYFLGGYIVRKFVPILGVAKLMQIGISVLCLGGVTMLIACLQETSVLAILLPTVIYVLGARIVIPNAVAGCLEEFKASAGCASGLIGAIQMLGSALISTVMSQFSIQSALPLALCLLLLGLACIVSYRSLVMPTRVHS